MSTMRADVCVVCRQRITMSGWEPFCCEVCYDAAYAADREVAEKMFPPEVDEVAREAP